MTTLEYIESFLPETFVGATHCAIAIDSTRGVTISLTAIHTEDPFHTTMDIDIQVTMEQYKTLPNDWAWNLKAPKKQKVLNLTEIYD